MPRFSAYVFVSTVFSTALFLPLKVLGQAPGAKNPASLRVASQSQVGGGTLVTLRGNVHPLARPEFDRGPAPADLPFDRMRLVMKRTPAQDAGLKQLLAAQQDRSSPNYHKWLTPEEFGRRFGPSTQDIQAISAWLESEGFKVTQVARGRTSIEFSGTVNTVENAFRTAIHQYVINGEEHWANSTEPQIPASLAHVVAGVATLHNFRKKPQIRVAPQPIPATYDPTSHSPAFTGTDGSHGLSPADYAVIYNINPLYQAGVNGTGTTIAIVAKSNIKVADITSFRSLFGLTPNAPKIILNGKDPGLVKNDETESLLDTSWSGAVAPNATVKLVVSADTNTADGVDLSEQYIIDNNLADVMTESYGDCEAHYTVAEALQIASLAQQAATQGITYMVSTGDSGSAGCDDPNTETTATGPFSVNILASTPYTVAVGGTQFNENGNNAAYWSANNNAVFESVLSYIPENVWNESCTASQTGCTSPGIWAGGGGASKVFTKPTWQAGVAGIPNDGARDVPDVSLSAASHDYYLLCQDGSCTANSKGQFSFQGVSGTSASAPSFAGMIALVNQKAGTRQGQVTPVLYQLAAIESLSPCNASSATLPAAGCVFNDVTIGNNAVPGEVGYGTANAQYQATVGWDPATGLGSVNVANLVNGWAGASSGSGQASISPTSLAFGSQSVAVGGAVQLITLTNPAATPLTIHVIQMAGPNPSDFSETNNCGEVIAAGASCTLSVIFAPVTTGSRTATLLFSDTATNSPQSVSLSGTGTINRGAAFNGEQTGDIRIKGDFDGDGQIDYATWRASTGIWYIYESSNPGVLMAQQWGLPGDVPVAADYDGDGRTDLAVWRPSNGSWYILPSRTRAPYTQQWGAAGDIPVPGDFDGDGKADPAVWRPSNQTWWFILSGSSAIYSFQWGLPGDVPVAGDFDRSGKQEMAVWRPSNGTWYVVGGATGAPFSQQWGIPGDVPVPADYDGDGITDFAVWRPADGNWYIVPSSNPGAPYTQQSGLPSSLLSTKSNVGTLGNGAFVRVMGDFDGDGQLDFGVWQPSSGNWYVIPSSTPASPISGVWGVPGDVPVPADYDGDGKADLAVWRPSNGAWYIIPSGGSPPYWTAWGLPGDVPVPADYSGNHKTELAVWRPSNGTWYIVPSTGTGPYAIQWGLLGDVPIAGDYDNDGKADFGIWRPSSQGLFLIESSQPSSPLQLPFGLTGNAEIYSPSR